MPGNAGARVADPGAAVSSLAKTSNAEDSANTANPQAEPLRATLKCHPACELLPEITEAEFRDLVEDIRANGLRHPIIVDENGLILDGRHRYRALRELGDPNVSMSLTARGVLTEADKIALVISENLHRRHLTTQQRAAIAAELANMKHGGDRKSNSIKASNDALTDAQAAKLLNVSAPSVERAKKRMRTDPEAHARAKAGRSPGPKPSKTEKRLRANLGERRANAFVERHPEIKPDSVMPALRGLETALRDAKMTPEQWAAMLAPEQRAEVHTLVRAMSDALDGMAKALFALRYPQSAIAAEPTLSPPAPTEELAAEQQGNGEDSADDAPDNGVDTPAAVLSPTAQWMRDHPDDKPCPRDPSAAAAWRRARGIQPPMKDYTCLACDAAFQGPVQRGQPPKFCPSCRTSGAARKKAKEAMREGAP